MNEGGEHNEAHFEQLLSRIHELHSKGLDWLQAASITDLENRIRNWPPAWGDDLQVLIYGDFSPPSTDSKIESLGITIHAGKLENTVIRSAMCVLKATVLVDEKSVEALMDASRRLNTLLGMWTLVSWGNFGCGWWSYVTHGSPVGPLTEFQQDDLPRALRGYSSLPEPVRKRIDAALHWIREPRKLFWERHRSDVLQLYAGYWNAFECLVEAVLQLRPRTKLSRSEKQRLIDEFVRQRNGNLTATDVQECYRTIVNPGLCAKASAALRECFGTAAQQYIDECFHLPERAERLYDIRNAINHGEVDAENPLELFRIESRLITLWKIVWRMFGCLIPFPAPAETSPEDT